MMVALCRDECASQSGGWSAIRGFFGACKTGKGWSETAKQVLYHFFAILSRIPPELVVGGATVMVIVISR